MRKPSRASDLCGENAGATSSRHLECDCIESNKRAGRGNQFSDLVDQEDGVCEFRNRDRFRRAILFHLGGLDLYLAAVEKQS